jgi:DMSO/TMAO reductase YedYZ heme-binding membrane subunit
MVLISLVAIGILPNSVNIIAVSGVILILAYKFRNMFKKAYIYYLIGLLLSSLSLFFYDSIYSELIITGIIGYSFLFVVMISGVLPKEWLLTRNLKRNRGMFSILSFIFISPHAISHALGLVGGISIFGIAAYILMVPLTIISFQIIRKEMDNMEWIKIQKAAYVIYLTLFIHLLVVADWENKLIYGVLFTLYINNKLIKEFKK